MTTLVQVLKTVGRMQAAGIRRAQSKRGRPVREKEAASVDGAQTGFGV